MDHPRTCGGTRPRDDAGAGCVDGVGAFGVTLGGIHRGVGRAVDHHVTGRDDALRRVSVGDVPLRRGQRQHIEALPRGFGRQKAPDLPTCTRDDDPIGHQQSLARRKRLPGLRPEPK